MRVPGAADAGVARVGFVEAQPAAASASTARLKPTSVYGRHWACTILPYATSARDLSGRP